jgi:hypothetical protein
MSFPSVFPVWWIAATALSGAVMSYLVLLIYGRWGRGLAMAQRQRLVLAVLAGGSIMAWRLSGNIPDLNDDPAGLLSPNDWLCPMLTFVVLSLYTFDAYTGFAVR